MAFPQRPTKKEIIVKTPRVFCFVVRPLMAKRLVMRKHIFVMAVMGIVSLHAYGQTPVWTPDSVAYTLKTDAKVGIGSGSFAPLGLLDIRGSGAHVYAGSGTTDFLGAGQTGYGVSNGTEKLFIAVQSSLCFVGSNSNTNLGFVTNNWTKMLIDTAGNVGIGTLSPGATLEVAGNGAKFSGTLATESHTDANVYAGVMAGTPRFILGGTTTHEIDNFAGVLRFFRPGVVDMAIDSAGNTGIGTSAPQSRLQVAGDLRIGSNATGGYTDLRIFTDAPETYGGTAYDQVNTIVPSTAPASGTKHSAIHIRNAVQGGTNELDLIVDGNITSRFQDVAEWVSAEAKLEPATVVVLDAAHEDQVRASTTAYDTSVAGVVSSKPGLILGVAAEGKEKIATTGRVKVRVDATRAAIAIGDLLVTSDVPGTAMKSQPMEINGRKFHQPGTVIGKALQPLSEGRGEILVLLSLQ
jgi:hypothetical protein